ncbi:MMS19 nucleotide excision repair protein homolog isoform X1 [Cryptomeria japonica]|uniref:MMS19 nucleotide excision repair protein homolog isoform X1 n=2 Tax=Cryptomeria japonica TaxID=3369 RepID=UPI0027DA030C|nr:MMS19 nucleotide excision repair protein homolog isoform X1 [Cryptomeria japonica]XP_057870324.2 MMS19 nucleotide excision repair protein homolog isoform X1 [Cryptomeria japonica]
MALSSWIPLVEAFVNPDNSPPQQAASLDAISSLVLGGKLTVHGVVSDMEVYLTTTDNAVRARGILLLAEILSRLKTKPLEDTSVHSLTVFFTSRLADWHAIRGALIGCLALLKRTHNVGSVSTVDAKKLAQSYLQNLQVQLLKLEDRMLCLELLECLLDDYADAVSPLGDDLVYGVCAAIDSETKPHCLLLAFHIVELLVRLFPDSEGPVASCAEDLFDIISRYFPLSFNPQPPNDSIGITREDLSRALLGAFMSSSHFAPFCIPLLLEKLSSSLHMAKVDSLRYLGKCAAAYGVDAMSNHATAIWASLKSEVLSSASPVSSIAGKSGFMENEVVEEALACLTQCICAFHKGNDTGVLLQLVVHDEQIEEIFNTALTNLSGMVIPLENKLSQSHYLLGKLLSAAAKSSLSSCSVVSQRFLPRLVNTIDLSLNSNGNSAVKYSATAGALSICHQILEANRILAEHMALQQHHPLDCNIESSWLTLLRHLSDPLKSVFVSAILTQSSSSYQKTGPTIENQIIHLGVAGLQALAAFPGHFSPLTEGQYRNILSFLVSILLKQYGQMLLWEQVLGALVMIGMSLEKFDDSTKIFCFLDVVIVELLSQLSIDNLSIPISLNLKAITAISKSTTPAIKHVLQGFRKVISTDFLLAAVKHGEGEGGEKSMEVVINILDCLSKELLSRCLKMGFTEDDVMQIALDILNSIEEISAQNISPPQKLLVATMEVMRVSVQYCGEDLQKGILLKSLGIVSQRLQSMSIVSPVASLKSRDDMQDDFVLINEPDQEEWKIALFASVVVALDPKVVLHNQRKTLKMFMNAVLRKGNSMIKDVAAQALGSMINKCPVAANGNSPNLFTLDEAIHSVLDEGLLRIVENRTLHGELVFPNNITQSLDFANIDSDDSIGMQVQAVIALAWIGKGLAMRGHSKISDVAMLLLNVLRTNSSICTPFPQNDIHKSEICKSMGKKFEVAEAAADGLGIIMKDSENSLNKECHAIIRPLYKQRFFTSLIPVLVLAIKDAAGSSRMMLYHALGHVISEAPHIALLAESEKLLPFILDGILVLSNGVENKSYLQSLLLSLSGIIVDENKGRTLAVEHVSTIISCLIGLVNYPHSMMVRETTLQCLGAMVALPYARIFPMRTQVLKAVSKALDDRKRAIRKEAVQCHRVWTSLVSK